VRQAIAVRLGECGGLQLHPEKTRVVYCRDGKRRGSYEHTSFTFLGYGFRVRRVRTRHGDYFFGFNPAVSEAVSRVRAQIRSWRLHLRSGWTLKDLAREVTMSVRGWISYYGRFYPSALVRSLNRVNDVAGQRHGQPLCSGLACGHQLSLSPVSAGLAWSDSGPVAGQVMR